MKTPSLLEHALLALVHQEPRSGYALRKIFATTPMGHYSSSPGTIYPALNRLQKRGWITGSIERGVSLRPQRIFSATPRGIEQLRRWLSERVTSDDVVWGMDGLMLRFAFIEGALGRSAALPFLRDLREALAAHVAAIGRFHAHAAASMPLTGRLALESGLEIFRTQLNWAIRAVAVLEADRSGGGKGARPRRSARTSTGASPRRSR